MRRGWESNPRPPDHKSDALTTEPRCSKEDMVENKFEENTKGMVVVVAVVVVAVVVVAVVVVAVVVVVVAAVVVAVLVG
ncbi:hypothetical protein ElyMa_006265000 [Elysia marginata]|uniref:Uncharacterized protein n=1 Tax=Elysia marginata TaxID=1093978 RepID=A0AAV4HBZ9_9GAST|nr:hypothetical protein ElyMa_006265000 [Elysia marginata]